MSIADWIIILAGIVISIWLWVHDILGRPQHFERFFYVFIGVHVLSGFVQATMWHLRGPGPFLQRITSVSIPMPVNWIRATGTANRAPTGGSSLLTILLPALVCGLAFLVITPSSTPTGDDELTISALLVIATMLTIAARLGGRLLFTLTLMPIFMVIGGLAMRPAPPTVGQAVGAEYTRASLIASGLLIFDIGQFIPMSLLWGHLGLGVLMIAWVVLSVALMVLLVRINNRSVAAAGKSLTADATP